MNNEMNYEYKVYYNITPWMLNKHGMDGWELVSVINQKRFNNDKLDCLFYMKRPVGKEKKRVFLPSKEALMKYRNMNIYEFNDSWSVRIIHMFNTYNIVLVGDLLTRSEHDLRKLRNFGNKSVKEISDCLEKHGLQLGMLSAENSVHEAAAS